MRGTFDDQGRLFSYISPEQRVPAWHPLRTIRALLLQAFYGVRSARQLMEQRDYHLLYRWFVGLSPDDAVWDATTFTKNREQLQAGDIFNRFMAQLLNHTAVRPLLSDEHFSVDGTLSEAWASHKSFKPKQDQDGDGANFHGTTRQNDTHARRTPTAACTVNRTARRAGSATWGMPRWRTDMVSPSRGS